MAYELEGKLLEVCTCNVLCPCWVGEDPDGGTCDGVLSWHIDQRHRQRHRRLGTDVDDSHPHSRQHPRGQLAGRRLRRRRGHRRAAAGAARRLDGQARRPDGRPRPARRRGDRGRAGTGHVPGGGRRREVRDRDGRSRRSSSRSWARPASPQRSTTRSSPPSPALRPTSARRPRTRSQRPSTASRSTSPTTTRSPERSSSKADARVAELVTLPVRPRPSVAEMAAFGDRRSAALPSPTSTADSGRSATRAPIGSARWPKGSSTEPSSRARAMGAGSTSRRANG